MPDFEIKVKALKMIWVKKLLEHGDEKWKCIPLFYFMMNGSTDVMLNMSNSRLLNVEISKCMP